MPGPSNKPRPDHATRGAVLDRLHAARHAGGHSMPRVCRECGGGAFEARGPVQLAPGWVVTGVTCVGCGHVTLFEVG